MRNALVFGGSGQIGAQVIERLLANDWRVTAVSRDTRIDSEHLSWLRGDLQHAESLPTHVDAIFSAGPLDHFSRWYANTDLLAPRVIAFGSTSVQTKQHSDDAYERDLADRLRAAETSIFAVAALRHSHATLLRPTLVYGAGRDQSLTRIIALARRSGFFVLPRNATGLRQPVHVQDLADAALSVVECEAARGRSYALPGGETLTYAEMVKRSLATLTPPAKLLRVPTPLFRVALSIAHLAGKLQGLTQSAVARMSQDLVFDGVSAQQDFGYTPRRFTP